MRVRLAAKGALLLIALATSVGIWTNTTSWAGGVSVESEAVMIADHPAEYPLQFDSSITAALTSLRANGPSMTGVADTFYSSYVAAGDQYQTALQSAAEQYLDTYQADPTGAKNTYLDDFGHARDDYFNNLESARNTLSSELSGTYDPQKDAFIVQFNSAQDTFNTQVESAMGEIARL